MTHQKQMKMEVDKPSQDLKAGDKPQRLGDKPEIRQSSSSRLEDREDKLEAVAAEAAVLNWRALQRQEAARQK